MAEFVGAGVDFAQARERGLEDGVVNDIKIFHGICSGWIHLK